MDIRKTWFETMDWVQLVQNGNWWWAFVNAVLNILVPKQRNFLTS
jgi:hypothetical protein